MESPLMAALQQFDATEANLVKLERISQKISALIPSGIEFGENPEYENLCRQWKVLLDALPKIDGWKPSLDASVCRLAIRHLSAPRCCSM